MPATVKRRVSPDRARKIARTFAVTCTPRAFAGGHPTPCRSSSDFISSITSAKRWKPS